jgi:hypothetical protein
MNFELSHKIAGDNNGQATTLEKVNPEICKRLQFISFDEFNDLWNKITTHRSGMNTPEELEKQMKKIKYYCRTQATAGEFAFEKVTGYTQKNNMGRYWGDNSIQTIHNAFRGALCAGENTDYDQKNSHPTLLLNLCNKYNINAPFLYDYVHNRQQFFDEFIKKDNLKGGRSEVKQYFLKVINKDKLFLNKISGKKGLIKFKKFLDLDKEIKEIQKQLYDIEDFKKYRDLVESKPDKYGTHNNRKGRFMSAVLCEFENYILQKVLNYCVENKIQVCSLMHDGAMISSNEDLCDIFNNITKDFGIKWDTKPHNTELIEHIMKLPIRKHDTNYILADNIIEIGKHHLKNYIKNRLVKCESQIYYKYEDLWMNKEKEIKQILFKEISEQDYWLKGEKKNIPVSKINKTIKEIIEVVFAYVETDNNFIDKIFTNSFQKVCFENGYYDFSKKEFIKSYSNCDTFIKINRDFKKSNNERLRKKIYKKILYPLFSIDKSKTEEENTIRRQLMNYFLYKMSRVIAGHYEDKNWFLLTGERNSGKGVITDLLKQCFGNYVKTTNSGNFQVKKFMAQDSAKANSWIVGLKFVRFLITQEITLNPEKKEYLCGNTIKKICSGGDDIEARQNNQDEIEFKIQSTLLMCANDTPPVYPSDAMETCKTIYMKSKFIDEDFKGEKLKNFSYYKKDPTIKTDFIKNDDIKNEFINILFETYYEPVEYPEILKQEEDEIDDEEDDKQTFFNLFSFTDKENDFISNKEIKAKLTLLKIPFSPRKVSLLLKAKGAEPSKKKGERGFKFIKFKTNEIDTEDEDEEEYSPKALETNI